MEQRFYFLTRSTLNDSPPNRLPGIYDNTRHYSEYAGTYAQDIARFSDETINDAFADEQDAYWNID